MASSSGGETSSGKSEPIKRTGDGGKRVSSSGGETSSSDGPARSSKRTGDGVRRVASSGGEGSSEKSEGPAKAMKRSGDGPRKATSSGGDTKAKMMEAGGVMSERIYEMKMRDKEEKLCANVREAAEVVEGMKRTQALDEKMIEDRKAADNLAQNGFTGKSGNPQRRRQTARKRRDTGTIRTPNFVKCIGSPIDTMVEINGESKLLEEFLEEHDMIRGIKSLPQCEAECTEMGAHKFSIECPRQNYYSLPVGLCVCLDDEIPLQQVPTKNCMPKVSYDSLCNTRNANFHMDRLNIMYSLGGSHAGAMYSIQENEQKNNFL